MSEVETTVLGQNLDDKSGTQTGNDEFDIATFVTENVGEGKKYGTLEDAVKGLAKSKVHADTFIETLKLEKQAVEVEKTELSTKLQQAKTVDDVIAAIQSDDSGQENHSSNTADGLSAEDVLKLIEQQNTAKAEADNTKSKLDTIKANQDKSWELLAKPEAFGSDANAKKAVADFIGKNKDNAEIINQMGGYNPQALVDLLKSQKSIGQADNQAQTQMNVSESLQSGGVLTWSSAQKVKKENPKLYRSRGFQMRMHQAAEADSNFLKT